MSGTHEGDYERGMMKQRSTLHITSSNQYLVRAQVDKVISHCIQSARNTMAEHNDLHRFESDVKLFEFIDSLLQQQQL